MSAGRVQSVALRLIVEREREIEKFVKEEYWSIDALFSKDKTSFSAKLNKIDGKTLGKFDIVKDVSANEVVSDLDGAKYTVTEIEKKEVNRTSSTLLQHQLCNKKQLENLVCLQNKQWS